MSTFDTPAGVGFKCDACEETWEPPKLGIGSAPRDFKESYLLARNAGWRAVKVKSKVLGKVDWEHRCSECA